MRILINPDPNLRVVATQLTSITDKVKRKIAAMLQMMYRANGIGLAATQVGWNQAVFVTNHTWLPENERVFINPQILSFSKDIVEASEGCLSVPGIVGAVDRPRAVLIRAQDLNGNYFEVDADGLLARCVQHEYDHLQGILFIDKAKRTYPAPGGDV
jgi:peptide deformylase